MKYDIKTIEGALHIITITVNEGVDFTNYSVYGSCGGGCCCKHFIIEDQTNTQCKVVIPALSRGVYEYQVFAKQNDTNKEFLILSGQVIAEDRICDNANNSIDYKTTIADVTISADTVEVSVTIEGIQGEDGEKGDDGGYYIPAVSADGDLSWTATESDMPTVATVNIRGPQGEQGEVGPQGPQGPQGEQGPAGEDGGIEWATATKLNEQTATPPEAYTNSIAIGYGAKTTGKGSVAIGNFAGKSVTTSADATTAVGGGANVYEVAGTAIGANTSVHSGAYNATAIGYGASNREEGTVLLHAQPISGVAGTKVYFVSYDSQLSRSKLNNEAGIYVETLNGTNTYAIPYSKLVELIEGGGGGGDTPETDTTSSSFSWVDYYVGLSKGYPTKYKDCYTTSDMSNINSEWRKDLTENCEWNYALDNLNESRPNFQYWYSDYDSSYGDLRSFNSYMPNVTNLYQAFQYCQELESWNCPTPQCYEMGEAFYGCTKLKHFRGDLSNILYASSMFGSYGGDCTQLDLSSVQHIANVINPNGGWNTISLGVSNTLQGSSELEEALQQIRDKNWIVGVLYSDNG